MHSPQELGPRRLPVQNQGVVAQREKWEGRGIEGRAGASQPEIWPPSANPRAPCARVLSGPVAATLRGFVDGLMTRDSDPGPSAPAAESMPARRCDGLPRRARPRAPGQVGPPDRGEAPVLVTTRLSRDWRPCAGAMRHSLSRVPLVSCHNVRAESKSPADASLSVAAAVRSSGAGRAPRPPPMAPVRVASHNWRPQAAGRRTLS